MKIIKLQVENIKRIFAVEINPKGNLIILGGRNGEGKTSILDAIEMVLADKSHQCAQPVRKGEKQAKVVCDLGDLIVTRTFTEEGGGTLIVASKDGAHYSSPQAMLDKLVGKLTFDPLEFSRQKPKEQLETLQALVGLDFTELDAKRQAQYDQRTQINREAKQIEGQLAGMVEHEDVPDEELSIADQMTVIDGIEATNETYLGWELEIKDQERATRTNESVIRGIEAHIRKLEEEVGTCRKDIEQAVEKEEARAKLITSLQQAEPPDISAEELAAAKEKVYSIEQINIKVRENTTRHNISGRHLSLLTESEDYTERIVAIDEKKATELAAAQFPIPDLSFDENGVLLNGLPFSQASEAEKLRVSMAMALAMNPKLKVALIRDGSLLDENSLKLVAEMAEAKDAQIWLERVGEGKECQVIIEDGQVKQGGSDG